MPASSVPRSGVDGARVIARYPAPDNMTMGTSAVGVSAGRRLATRDPRPGPSPPGKAPSRPSGQARAALLAVRNRKLLPIRARAATAKRHRRAGGSCGPQPGTFSGPGRRAQRGRHWRNRKRCHETATSAAMATTPSTLASVADALVNGVEPELSVKPPRRSSGSAFWSTR